jgi:hypothetical protein
MLQSPGREKPTAGRHQTPGTKRTAGRFSRRHRNGLREWSGLGPRLGSGLGPCLGSGLGDGSGCRLDRRLRVHRALRSAPRRLRLRRAHRSPPRRLRVHRAQPSPPRRRWLHRAHPSPPRRRWLHRAHPSPPRRRWRHRAHPSPPRRCWRRRAGSAGPNRVGLTGRPTCRVRFSVGAPPRLVIEEPDRGGLTLLQVSWNNQRPKAEQARDGSERTERPEPLYDVSSHSVSLPVSAEHCTRIRLDSASDE